MEPYELSLAQASERIRTKELSPLELTRSALDRLHAVEPEIKAFAFVSEESALSEAAAAGEEIAAGTYRGPLHGIPIGVKDLYDTAGVPTTSSSAVRADHMPTTDSAAVARLYDAGVVVLGKTHTHEFAFGATTPTTRNPWDTSTVPGGSSGGSGAAVGAGVTLIGLGSDTGGSIRIPAAVCGTVGLKPTYGRASRAGVASLSWSLDHVGPLTRNVTDSAVVLNAMAGYDRRDPASVDRPVPDFTAGIEDGVRGMRIGIPRNFYTVDVDPEITAATAASAVLLESMGAELVEIDIPYADLVVSTLWGIMMPEASAYHRDAIRATPELYTEEVRDLILVGEAILATDYINALRVRTLMQRAWRDLYESVDVVLAPSVAALALDAEDPVATWEDGRVEAGTSVYSRLSGPANLTGMPSLSVPSGFSRSGLPMGVQLIGRPFEEAVILRAGRALERATDVVGRIAPLGGHTTGAPGAVADRTRLAAAGVAI
jgi:aspartyl-tRNA(Asn)/glutamyl-tRNA(Gln) amidotransferase subunit A